ncbi:MAG: hypothetical protein M0R70_11580 [Nitrospirae bacterium]|nr:hypothetical protein [Nitrospirota bacterium]
MRHPRYSSTLLFFSLVLLFTGFQGASADTPEQPGTHPTTNSDPASTVTSTLQNTSSPTAPKKPKTDKAPQPAAKTEPPVRLGPQVDPCFTVSVAGDNWLDQLHGYVQDHTCEPAVWFDTFFVKDHILLDLRPGTFIKIRTSARLAEGSSLANNNEFRLEWNLPQWTNVLKRWKLYIESRSAADKYMTQPGQPIQPGVDRETGERKPVVGVRVDLYTKLRSLVSFESGAKIGIHSDAFIRMRYQYDKPFSEVYLVRFSEIAMWQAVEHFTNTTQLDFERKIATFALLRWGNNMTYTEGANGVTWNSGISLFTQLTPKSAISYDTSIWGVSYPDWRIDNYRVGSLYRRNFYRPWLFFELGPEVTWPKDESGRRNSVYAFMATFEIQFGK